MVQTKQNYFSSNPFVNRFKGIGQIMFQIMVGCFIIPFTGLTQSVTGSGKGLFESDSVLKITLSADINHLLNDRGDNPKYHPLIVSYTNKDGKEFSIKAEAKTRGHFRRMRANCIYPPLLLHFFKSDSLQSSLFKNQEKLKLVMPCRDDKYLVYEWLAYKLYNIITPKSFRARLVSITFADNRKKPASPFYGILLEAESQMAKRNKQIVINRQMKPENTQQDDFLKMAVFEYLIGNTDWSVQYLQNIKLVAADSLSSPSTVPYDFDHAGIVDAPYAQPAEELEMNSVKERRYRGYCMQDIKDFDSVNIFINTNLEKKMC